MSALGRIGAFVTGGLLGAGIGAAIATLVAPRSGEELRRDVEQKVDQVRVAGLEAQTRTEEELIRRFRAETGDAEALRDDETQRRIESAQAIADVGLAPAARLATDAAASLD